MNHHLQTLLQEIKNLNIQNGPNSSQKLKNYIKKTYEEICNNDPLTDWQKIKIAYAVAAYKINWLYLSKFSLMLAFEDPQNISQEKWHVIYLKETADQIDIAKLIDEI